MARKVNQTLPSSGAQLPAPEALPADGFTRWDRLKTLVPFSRETLRKRELDGHFPKRQRLSERCSAWNNRELHRWFADPQGYRAEGQQ